MYLLIRAHAVQLGLFNQKIVAACRMKTVEVSQIDQKTSLMHSIPSFGIATLSLMGYQGLQGPIDPVCVLQLPVKMMHQILQHQKSDSLSNAVQHQWYVTVVND